MIVSKILDIAAKFPDKIAVITSEIEYTYRDLETKIRDAVKVINEMNLCETEPIAIIMPNCIEFIVYLCAAELTKHCAVLLSDKFKTAEVDYHIRCSGVRYLVYRDRVICRESSSTEHKPGFYPDDFICQTTSGTNGVAKGAVRTSSAVMYEIEETLECIPMYQKDIVLTLPPIYHSFGLIAGTLAPLCMGASLIFMNSFVVADAIKIMHTYQATILFAVPFMYQMVCDTNGIKEKTLTSLRLCLSAGAPLQEDLFYKFYKISGVFITQDYGSTETGVMCINTESDLHLRAIGKPVGSRLFRVLNEKGEDCPAGEAGILITMSHCDAVRYLYPAEFNFQFKNGWLCIGDYGYVGTDGYLYVQGRMTDMINVAGLKVDPAEVEQVILEMQEVKEVVVVGKPAKPYGEVVKAVIVSSGDITIEDIIIYCREKLADYKVPKVIEMTDNIPKSPTGKVQRKYLI